MFSPINYKNRWQAISWSISNKKEISKQLSIIQSWPNNNGKYTIHLYKVDVMWWSWDWRVGMIFFVCLFDRVSTFDFWCIDVGIIMWKGYFLLSIQCWIPTIDVINLGINILMWGRRNLIVGIFMTVIK